MQTHTELSTVIPGDKAVKIRFGIMFGEAFGLGHRAQHLTNGKDIHRITMVKLSPMVITVFALGD